MKFSHQNFHLIIETKNSNLENNKPLEFIFGDENTYKKELKNIGGNFKKDIEGNFDINENEISLNAGYNKEKGNNNIFFDYTELVFYLSDDYNLSIESDYTNLEIFNSGFLKSINSNDGLNKYELVFKSPSEKEKVYGFWGFIKFVISKGNEKYIFAPFFKTKNLGEDNDVLEMLSNIKEELFYSLFTNKNISLNSYKIKNQKDLEQSKWSFINIFDMLYSDLEKNINDITENAKYINSISSDIKKYNGGKITIDNRFINNCIKNGYYNSKNNNLEIYGKKIIQKKIIGEYNNISNKIFIDLNQSLINKLDSFLSVGEKKIKKEYLDKIKEKRDKISSKRTGFINKYNLNINKLGNLNIDYQHLDSRYKKFVINYLKLFLMLDLLNGEIMLANKSIDQIYEYWVLIKTRDILVDLLGAKKDKENIFKIKKNNNDLVFELGNNEKVEINGEKGTCNIIYKFQQSIQTIPVGFKESKKLIKKDEEEKTKIHHLRTLSARVIPDIFIELNNKVNKEIFEYIVLDAKYSTDKNIKYRFENLYKYKSGILNCENLVWNGKDWGNEKSIKPLDNLDVIAIYPGINKSEIEDIEDEEKADNSYEDENIDFNKSNNKLVKLYEKAVEDIGFGGFVMRPNNGDELKKYLEKRVKEEV